MTSVCHQWRCSSWLHTEAPWVKRFLRTHWEERLCCYQTDVPGFQVLRSIECPCIYHSFSLAVFRGLSVLGSLSNFSNGLFPDRDGVSPACRSLRCGKVRSWWSHWTVLSSTSVSRQIFEWSFSILIFRIHFYFLLKANSLYTLRRVEAFLW